MRLRLRSTLAAAILAASAGLAAARRGAPPARPAPEILWDRWGVPHLYASSDADLEYAFGWAQAQSHGDLVLRLYAEARGRSAEVWGAGGAASDRLVRTLGIPTISRAWYGAQTADERRRLDAFAAGFNAYAREHPERLDERARAVLPVTGADVTAHMLRTIHFTFLSSPQSVAARYRPRPQAGSNAWAVAPRRSASGHALLLANPHLPWGGAFAWYEAQMTAPGIDAYGVALVGFPFLGIAFNDVLGWTHTVNTLDAADVYELTLEGGGYRWEGGVRAFERERETVRVRQGDGSFRDDTFTVRRSVHGPVLAERGGKAYALRVAGLDQPHMLGQYWEMARARSLAQFERAVSRLQMPMFTVMYADRDGHILSLFNGRVPVRARGGWADWQGTVRGDSAWSLWTATVPYAGLPRVLDPPSGWLQNANDPPWSTTFPRVLRPRDYPAWLAPTGMELRPQRSVRLLESDSSLTLDELVALKHSTRAELADRVLAELLLAARASGGPGARRGAEVLARWDRATDAGSRGAVLFAEWARLASRGGLFAVPWREDAPLETPDGLRDPAAAVAALDSAVARVERAWGAADVAWGDVYRLRRAGVDLPGNGGPDELGVFRALWFGDADEDGRFGAVGGDTYVAAVEFGRPVRARALLAYGNASQRGSRHRADQLPLFAGKELRPVWRTRAEVEANLEERTALHPTAAVRARR